MILYLTANNWACVIYAVTGELLTTGKSLPTALDL